MRREGLTLRIGGLDKQFPKPRLLDLKGKRLNNRISIYSHKYNNLMSTQSLHEDSTRVLSTTSILKSDLNSTEYYEGHSMSLMGDRTNVEYIKDSSGSKAFQEKIASLIQKEITAAQFQFQARARDLLEANTRTISELRQILFDQQKQLIEKQQIIHQLFLDRHTFYNKRVTIGTCELTTNSNNPKLKNGEYNYLRERVVDLETKIKIILQSLSSGEEETSLKISRLEEQLIKYNGTKLTHCRYRLEQALNIFSKKLESYEPLLKSQAQQPKFNISSSLDSIKQQCQECKRHISNFAQKSYIYQSEQLTNLQNLLFFLNQQLNNLSLRGSRHKDYDFDDEDEFFYPQSERIQETNDEYQHFLSDFQEEKQKNENESSNCKRDAFKYQN